MGCGFRAIQVNLPQFGSLLWRLTWCLDRNQLQPLEFAAILKPPPYPAQSDVRPEGFRVVGQSGHGRQQGFMQLLQALAGLGYGTPETARTSGFGEETGRLEHRVGSRQAVTPAIQQVLQSLALPIRYPSQEEQGEVQGLGTHPAHRPFQPGLRQPRPQLSLPGAEPGSGFVGDRATQETVVGSHCRAGFRCLARRCRSAAKSSAFRSLA